MPFSYSLIIEMICTSLNLRFILCLQLLGQILLKIGGVYRGQVTGSNDGGIDAFYLLINGQQINEGDDFSKLAQE